MSSNTRNSVNLNNNQNINSNNLNSNVSGGGAITNVQYRSNNKKVDEVKEVVQNKPDHEIAKVLEYFDYDVGKTIDAFVNDGGKDALTKWHEAKASKRLSQQKKISIESSENNNHFNTNNHNHNNNKNSKRQDKSQLNTNDDSNLLQVNQKNNNKNKTSKSPNNGNHNGNHNENNNNNNTNTKIDLKSSLNLNNNNNNKQKFLSSSLSVKKTTNINDLVASVINQYTSSTPTTPLSGSISSNMQLLANDAITPSQEQANQTLLDNLNRLVVSSQNPASNLSNTATIGGFKVTVLGVQTNKNENVSGNQSNASPVISSVSSSPSSMSVASNLSLSSSMNGHSTKQNGRSSLLDMKNNTNKILPLNSNLVQIPIEKRVFNTSYFNPNAKQFLEKHQKDLQRQTAVLTRTSSVFQDDLNKSHMLLNQTFSQLRQLLNDRQAQLEAQLISAAQMGSNLLQQRQAKAAELKISTDNAQHLTDHETQELKADIKHFVSERQLDEEFGKLKFLNIDSLTQLNQAINSFGSIITLTNKYATQRPPTSELNDLSPTIEQKPQQLNSNVNNVNGKGLTSTNVNNNKNNSVKLNGNHSTKLANSEADKNNNNKQQNFVQNGAVNNTPKVNGNSNDKNVNNKTIIENKINGAYINDYIDDEENKNEGEFIEVKKPQRNKNKLAQQQQQQQIMPQQPQPNTNGHKNPNQTSNNSNNNNNKKFPKQNGFNTSSNQQYAKTVSIK